MRVTQEQLQFLAAVAARARGWDDQRLNREIIVAEAARGEREEVSAVIASLVHALWSVVSLTRDEDTGKAVADAIKDRRERTVQAQRLARAIQSIVDQTPQQAVAGHLAQALGKIVQLKAMQEEANRLALLEIEARKTPEIRLAIVFPPPSKGDHMKTTSEERAWIKSEARRIKDGRYFAQKKQREIERARRKERTSTPAATPHKPQGHLRHYLDHRFYPLVLADCANKKPHVMTKREKLVKSLAKLYEKAGGKDLLAGQSSELKHVLTLTAPDLQLIGTVEDYLGHPQLVDGCCPHCNTSVEQLMQRGVRSAMYHIRFCDPAYKEKQSRRWRDWHAGRTAEEKRATAKKRIATKRKNGTASGGKWIKRGKWYCFENFDGSVMCGIFSEGRDRKRVHDYRKGCDKHRAPPRGWFEEFDYVSEMLDSPYEIEQELLMIARSRGWIVDGEAIEGATLEEIVDLFEEMLVMRLVA